MIEKIYQFAEENGLLIGICKAPLPFPDPIGDRPFPSQGLIKEYEAFAKSIIVAGLNLYKKTEGYTDDGVPRGRLSFVALGTDYHLLLTAQLQRLADILLHYKSFKYKIHVDTGPLPEKDLAVSAGLGFKGRNSLVISPEFGSFFAIGLILVDFELPESTPRHLRGCGSCKLCVKACPTGALSTRGLNWHKCISYLTQSKALSEEDESLLMNKNPNNYLYGCDCCQLVCPYNQGLKAKETACLEAAYPRLEALAAMSRKEMKNRFGATAAGWRLNCIKRNSKFCLKNNKMGENRNGILEHPGSAGQHP